MREAQHNNKKTSRKKINRIVTKMQTMLTIQRFDSTLAIYIYYNVCTHWHTTSSLSISLVLLLPMLFVVVAFAFATYLW